MTTPQRRLSAILHADLAGFVRLVENAEDLTFKHLRSARAKICQPAIESAGGSLVHSAGDSMLAEFSSALAAVKAAIDIQEGMARFNEGLTEDEHWLVRIRVNVRRIIRAWVGSGIYGK